MSTNNLFLNNQFIIPDISSIIFSLCAISDKRNLIRTCKTNNLLKQFMRPYEKQFKKQINNSELLNYTMLYDNFMRFTRFDNPLYKYTLELIHDNNCHLIPDRYFCQENRIMIMYPAIYRKIAQEGNLPTLKKMLKIVPMCLNQQKTDYRTGWENYTNMSIGAALGNHLNILQWMLENNYKIDTNIVSYAASGNNFELLKQLTHKNFALIDKTLVNAIKTGNDEMTQWILSKIKICHINDIIGAAVKMARLDIIESLHEKFTNKMTEICNQAIVRGNIEILKWGLEQGYEITTEEYSDEDDGVHLHMLQWLKENGYLKYKSNELTFNAASVGNLDVLKWAKMNDFPFDSLTMAAATDKKHDEIIKWGLSEGFTIDVAYYAASNGNKEILELALNNGSKLSKKLCHAAAWNGHLSILKMLRDRGCKWDDEISYVAAKNGQFKLLKWAYSEGCPINETTCEATVAYNEIEILKWLYKQGCPWDDSLCERCIELGNVEIIDWITSKGFTWNEELYTLLMISDDADLVEWRKMNISKL